MCGTCDHTNCSIQFAFENAIGIERVRTFPLCLAIKAHMLFSSVALFCGNEVSE